MNEFSKDFCDQRHLEMERRMTHVEQALSQNLEKLYGKIDSLGNEMTAIALKRQPPWVTFAISLLSAACVGLIVAAVK